MTSEIKEYAIISVYYKDKYFKSLPIDLSVKDHLKMVTDIAQYGTNDFKMFKLPLTETRFVVLSKSQLDETVFDIEIINELPKKTKTKA